MEKGKEPFQQENEKYRERQQYEEVDVFLDEHIIDHRLYEPGYGTIQTGDDDAYEGRKRNPPPVRLNEAKYFSQVFQNEPFPLQANEVFFFPHSPKHERAEKSSD